MNNFVKTIVSTLKPRIHDSLLMEHPQPGEPLASSAPWESRMPEVQVDHLELLLPTLLRRQLYQAEHIEFGYIIVKGESLSLGILL